MTMAMATVRMAEVLLLLMFLTQIFGVHQASAARPLEGAGWTVGGTGMVITDARQHQAVRVELLNTFSMTFFQY